MWKEMKKKDEDIQRIYTLRKKRKKEKERDSRKDTEHDRSTLRKHIYRDQVKFCKLKVLIFSGSSLISPLHITWFLWLFAVSNVTCKSYGKNFLIFFWYNIHNFIISFGSQWKYFYMCTEIIWINDQGVQICFIFPDKKEKKGSGKRG